jgi:transcriptional regulator with XRE-family HTH domain
LQDRNPSRYFAAVSKAEWPARLTAVVADEVRRHRERRGWSVRQLSEELDKLGFAMAPPVISNLELKRRPTVSVGEWLALAAALRVPPLLLLFPVGRTDQVEPLPDVQVPPFAAVQWMEDGHMVGVEPPFTEDEELITSFREHQSLVSRWAVSRRKAMRLRETLGKSDEELASRDESRRELEFELSNREQQERLAVEQLLRVRESIERVGALLPHGRLPAALMRQLDGDA